MTEMKEEMRIERSIEIEAPIERVWALLTTSSELPRWWTSMATASVDLRPGGEIRFEWEKEEHGVTAARVVDVAEPHLFSWYWAASNQGEAPSPGDQTLVEFRLEHEAGVTRVTVFETGFEELEITPQDRLALLEGNVQGWTEVLGYLRVAAAR